MSILLAIADLATSPSGVGVVVSGSISPSDTVTLFSTPADRPWPEDDWENLGTCAASGGTFFLPMRHYFLYASAGIAVTPPVRVAVTDGLQALATRCRASVVATLIGMDLPSIGEKVYDRMYMNDEAMQFPCLCVSVVNQVEAEESGTNALDTIGYPLQVDYIRNMSMGEYDKIIDIEYIRERVSNAFRYSHLAGVPESIQTKVQPSNLASPISKDYAKYIGGMKITNFVRQPRGIGA